MSEYEEADFTGPGIRYPLPLPELVAVVQAQTAKYGPFVPDVAGVRLAVAVLEDETAETRDAWREERRLPTWAHTREEALQVAAVALRLAAALGVRSDTEGAPSDA